MNLARNRFLICIAAGSLIVLSPLTPWLRSALSSTHWETRTSEGFDALCALNLLSGDTYYLEQYPQEALAFAAPRYAGARLAARRLKAAIKDEEGGIISAFLTLIFSGGPDSSLDSVLASARAPDKLYMSFRASAFWSEESWTLFRRVLPDVIISLDAMRQAGFHEDWRSLMGKGGSARAAALRAELARYDVLGEQARLVGHELQRGRIEVILLHYSRPHGIRIQGSRFLTNIGYPASIVLRNAAHEPLHPPYDAANPRLVDAVGEFARDSLVVRVVRGHNPSLGYTTVTGYVEEDAVQALEQVVSERMGLAVPARKRWQEGDDGMHLLAAAIYHLILETRFSETGGRFETWFIDAVAAGHLNPAEVERRARAVVGDAAVDRWRLSER